MTSDLERLCADARERMVDSIAARGDVSPKVLAALRQIPRHIFADRFWAPPPGTPAKFGSALPEWTLDENDPDPAAISLVYSPERALPLKPVTDWPRRVGSTISAPDLIASMLDLLELRPGMRVLEIGTGSGYNAALIAVLLGDPDLLTSVEIDGDMAAHAGARFAAIGCRGVHIVVGDGHLGSGVDAPAFDRIIATVGCRDLSPHWRAQLVDGGFALVPVAHAGTHPLVRARPTEGGWTGDLVGRSGFVDVQGYQDAPGPWTEPPERNRVARSLPFAPVPASMRFDFGFFVGLSDTRAWRTGLADDESSVMLDAREDRVLHFGPHGRALVRRLSQIADEWEELGRPELKDYATTWWIHSARPAGLQRVDQRRWIISRVEYDEEVVLT